MRRARQAASDGPQPLRPPPIVAYQTRRLLPARTPHVSEAYIVNAADTRCPGVASAHDSGHHPARSEESLRQTPNHSRGHHDTGCSPNPGDYYVPDDYAHRAQYKIESD